MTLKTPDTCERVKNMAGTTLALVTASPVKICQKKEMAKLEVVKSSLQNTGAVRLETMA